MSLLTNIKPQTLENASDFIEHQVGEVVKYDEADLYYANGFAASNALELFPQVREHWHAFFERFGLGVSLGGLSTSFVFPKTADRVLPVTLMGENCVIAVNKKEVRQLAETAGIGTVDEIVDAFSEYLMRRLVVSLVASWEEEDPIEFVFPKKNEVDELDVVGVVVADFDLDNMSVRLVVGLSPGMTDLFNETAKKVTIRRNVRRFTSLNKNTLDAELVVCGLDVSGEALPDLVRSGNAVMVNKAHFSKVLLMLGGSFYAQCSVVQADSKMALSVDKVLDETACPTSALLSLGSFELDQRAAFEGLTHGGLIVSPHELGSNGRLVFRGEEIAQVQYGSVDSVSAILIK